MACERCGAPADHFLPSGKSVCRPCFHAVQVAIQEERARDEIEAQGGGRPASLADKPSLDQRLADASPLATVLVGAGVAALAIALAALEIWLTDGVHAIALGGLGLVGLGIVGRGVAEKNRRRGWR